MKQVYFEVASGFEPQNEWSLADYKRRVSPTATIEAWYEPFRSKHSLFQNASNVSISGGTPSIRYSIGFAAGGQMYHSPYLRLSIVLLTLNVSERRKYIETKILPGYDVVAF